MNQSRISLRGFVPVVYSRRAYNSALAVAACVAVVGVVGVASWLR